jgi:uncharacterized protein (TIGR00251 family)
MNDKIKNQFKDKKEIFIKIKVRTGAVKSGLGPLMADGTYKVDIAKQPEKGKANKELTSLLAKEFDVSLKSVKIISGASSKSKLVKISIKNQN